MTTDQENQADRALDTIAADRRPTRSIVSVKGGATLARANFPAIVADDDPFWGTKLIEKLAENILSALTSPEDALFKSAIEDEAVLAEVAT